MLQYKISKIHGSFLKVETQPIEVTLRKFMVGKASTLWKILNQFVSRKNIQALLCLVTASISRKWITKT